MEIEVSIGEIVDKLSILHIKKENIKDENKLKNIDIEYNYLYDIVFNKIKVENTDFESLLLVNNKLWIIEDDIRELERQKNYNSDFIRLARLVYITNDERSIIKKDINIKYGSTFTEEKSYSAY